MKLMLFCAPLLLLGGCPFTDEDIKEKKEEWERHYREREILDAPIKYTEMGRESHGQRSSLKEL